MSAVIVTLLILGGIVYVVLALRWWPVLNDPDHYTREDTEEEMEHIRYFASLPKPKREWNQ